MHIALWIAQGLLAAAFLLAGVMKLTQRKEKIEEDLPWAEDFGDGQVRVIGALEMLAALGLVLPGALGIAPVLVPLAAVGVVLVMIGAIALHLRRRESQRLIMNLMFMGMAVFIAWGRFGAYSF